MGNIVGLGHVSFTVMDLDRTIDFYVNILGGTLFDRNRDEGDNLGKYVFGNTKSAYASLAIAMIRLGEINIEFIEYLDPPTVKSYHGDPSIAGSAHIAWEVDNIEEVYSKLKKEGVKFHSEINDCIRDNELVWKWVYFRDPDNICVELTQQFKNYQ